MQQVCYLNSRKDYTNITVVTINGQVCDLTSTF